MTNNNSFSPAKVQLFFISVFFFGFRVVFMESRRQKRLCHRFLFMSLVSHLKYSFPSLPPMMIRATIADTTKNVSITFHLIMFVAKINNYSLLQKTSKIFSLLFVGISQCPNCPISVFASVVNLFFLISFRNKLFIESEQFSHYFTLRHVRWEAISLHDGGIVGTVGFQ